MAAPRKYPAELRKRAVRAIRTTGWLIFRVAKDPGIHEEALRGCVRQPEPVTESAKTGCPPRAG